MLVGELGSGGFGAGVLRDAAGVAVELGGGEDGEGGVGGLGRGRGRLLMLQ